MTRSLGLAAWLVAALAAARARADSPKLAEARRAVAAVDYDAARRLLVEALHDGDNSPAAVGEIYRLSARAAVVLEQRDLAEQYYRRWLAIDPGAALPGDTAPKLREPFVAAQAYIAAHGPLRARAQRTSTGDIDVELLADPLAMAHAAAAADPVDATAGPGVTGPQAGTGTTPTGPGITGSQAGTGTAATGPDITGPQAGTGTAATGPGIIGSQAAAAAAPSAAAPTAASSVRRAVRSPAIAFGAERRVRLAAAARVAILDDSGNRLLELDPEPAGPAAALAAPPPPAAAEAPSPPWTQRWVTWAIPTGVFTLGAAGFGIAAIASYGRAHEIADASGQYFLSDADANVRRGRIFVWITAGAGVAAIGCAIPTAIYYLRGHDLRHLVLAPTAGPDHVGLVLGGRF